MRPRRSKGDRDPVRKPGGLPWEPRTDDVGLRIVDEVGYAMTLDDEWSVRDERGFTWWGKDLAQRVWSEPGFDDDGFEIFRLHAQTELLRDFDAMEESLGKLNALSALATTSGFLVDEDEGTVRLVASMYAHEETEGWAGRLFKLVAAMQAADAQIKAALLAEVTGATVAATPHPLSGPRPDLDDMLNVLEQVVVPHGQGMPPWRGEDMEWTTAMVRQGPNVVLAMGDESGLTLELPFQSRTSLVTVTTDAPNPQLGNGVLLLLHLPMTIAQADGVRFAAELGRREVAELTRAHHLGGWCWRDDGMHYVTFLPNVAYGDRGDLLNLLGSTASRARWVAETLYGDDWDANRDEHGRPLATPAALDLMALAGLDVSDEPEEEDYLS
jgi:hypothetical protein